MENCLSFSEALIWKFFTIIYAFAAHLTHGVKTQLLESKSDILPTPAGCTSKCQSMDVSLNKPFKTALRRSWVEYVASVIEGFLNANSDTSFKLPVLTRQHMIDWVKEGFDYLVQDQEMVKKFFRVCGISSLDPDEVRMVPFLNSVREKQCSIWRSMKLMILLSCTLHMLLWNP